MIYFAKNFGYRVSGIDYSDEIRHVASTLNESGIKSFELFHCDFFHFDPETKYDIVFSAGFVEHFSDPNEVFQKHVDLVKDDGWLVISLPNFQYAQKLLRVVLGMKNDLSSHNLDVMYPIIWRNLAQAANLEILYCDYIHTFQFWTPPDYDPRLAFLIDKTVRLIEKTLAFFHLDRVPNCYFSPHILLVARKGNTIRYA